MIQIERAYMMKTEYYDDYINQYIQSPKMGSEIENAMALFENQEQCYSLFLEEDQRTVFNAFNTNYDGSYRSRIDELFNGTSLKHEYIVYRVTHMYNGVEENNPPDLLYCSLWQCRNDDEKYIITVCPGTHYIFPGKYGKRDFDQIIFDARKYRIVINGKNVYEKIVNSFSKIKKKIGIKKGLLFYAFLQEK